MFEMNNSEKEEYYKEFAEKAKKVYENALKNPSTFKSISNDQTMSAIDTDIDEQQLLRDAVKDTNSQIKKEKDNRCNS